jgi:hypothetical protein
MCTVPLGKCRSVDEKKCKVPVAATVAVVGSGVMRFVFCMPLARQGLENRMRAPAIGTRLTSRLRVIQLMLSSEILILQVIFLSQSSILGLKNT